jgi:PAS domain S-box-containing protein
MANGDEEASEPDKVEIPGQIIGEKASGRFEAHSYNPAGNPGIQHWASARVTDPDLGHRSGIFFAAVEMTRMPMVVTDPNLEDNPIVFANGAFLDLTGYDEDEIVGRNCRFLQGAQTNRDTVREIRDAVSEVRPVAVEILNYKKDGTPFWNALFMGPIYDQNEKPLYFFASQLDVTRRRVSEQAFRHAQKMEAIGQLSAGLAHDLNNSMQIAVGNLQRATEQADKLNPGEEGTELRRAIEGADHAIRQSTRLTGQLLTFARKTRLDPKPTDLNTQIPEFGEMLARALGDQIIIKLELSIGVPRCTVDQIHLEMALLNVLLNARDAMPIGGTATVFTEKLRMGEAEARGRGVFAGDYAVLGVRDHGSGMPPGVLERATEPFFTTKPPGKGSGLGLAMVHGFVQQSGGLLDITSQPGSGTIVRMIFPAATTGIGLAPVSPAAGGAQEEPEKVRPGASSLKILAVDDNPEVLSQAAQILTRVGYEVLTATSGEQALDILAADGAGISLLFTDVVMPGGMNGLALAEQTRASHPNIAILLTTAYTDELTAEDPKAPAMDVLGKPYRQTELADRIRASLNRHAAGHHLRPPRRAIPRHEG